MCKCTECNFSSFDIEDFSASINVSDFLKDLRCELNLTIDEFVEFMGWKNSKYYSKIVNGYVWKGKKKYSNPTVKYIFGGLNYAFFHHEDLLKDKKENILKIINKYFLYGF